MNSTVVRIVSGVLGVAIVSGIAVRPPQNMNQAIGAALPALMLFGMALRGTRRSLIPRKKSAPPPKE